MNIKFLFISLILPFALWATSYDRYIVTLASSPSQSPLSIQSISNDLHPLPSVSKHSPLSIQHNSVEHAIWVNDHNISHEAAVSILSQRDDIAIFEPVYPIQTHATFNDLFYAEQTYMIDFALDRLHQLPASHDIVVALLDTGVDVFHPDVADAIHIRTEEVLNGVDDDENGVVDDRFGVDFYGYSDLDYSPAQVPMDEFGHGTHLAGLLAAKSNNGLGIVGLNSRVQIMNLKFLNQYGRGNQVDAAYAIRYAVDNGAHVINCSWGFYRYNTILRSAIQYALDSGVVVIAAVGNSNIDVPEYPSAFPGVIAVGSVATNRYRSGFSSYGEHVDFVMPGESVFSLMPDQKYGTLSGTSQSAAILSAVVARVLSYSDSISPAEIFEVLRSSVDDLDEEGKDRYTGYGYVNTEKLLEVLAVDSIETTPISRIETQAGEATLGQVMNIPNPMTSDGTHFSFVDTQGGRMIRIRIYDFNGHIQQELHQVSQVGVNRIFWDGRRVDQTALSRGSYFWVLDAEDQTEIYKNILVVQ